MYRSEVVILSYRFVGTLLGLVEKHTSPAYHHHLAFRLTQSLLFLSLPSSSFLLSLVLYGTRVLQYHPFPLPRVIPELSSSRTIPTSRYRSDARPPKCRFLLLSTTLYDLALPRSLVPPRKPWTECARHRVLVVLVVFSLVSPRPAYSFLSSSRHSSRVHRLHPAFSFLLPIPRLQPNPLSHPTFRPFVRSANSRFHAAIPSRRLRSFLIHPIT